MKKYTLFLAIICLCVMNSQAQQDFSTTPGKITQHEISMTEFKDDKDAEAIMIYHFGDYFFQGDYNQGRFILHKYIKMKIKILKQAGLDQANFEIPVYHEGNLWEDFNLESAVTTNLGAAGGVQKTTLDKKNIFKEKINSNWDVMKFTMPDVKVGSVLEVEYSIATPYFFNMGKWNFQRKIPVVYSELRYKAIPFYEYTYIVKGGRKFDKFENRVIPHDIQFGQAKYKEMEYFFGMKNIPAFKDETFITSAANYMYSVEFQLSRVNSLSGSKQEIISTWPKLSDELLKEDDFGKYIKSSEKAAKDVLSRLDVASLPDIEKLKVITNYVKFTYNWDGGYGKFTQKKVSDFMKAKTGNDAEINLFLIGLLKAAGFDAVPLLISTRENGSISKLHPFLSFFNYVIAAVNTNEKTYYLDATESLLDFEELPERCINIEGLLIKPKSEEWVVVREEKPSLTKKEFELTISPETQKMNIKAIYTAKSHSSYNYKSRYMGKEENLTQFFLKTHNVNIQNITCENYDKPDQDFIFHFDMEQNVEGTPDKLFVPPFTSLALSENPFKQESRTLAVDLVYIRSEQYKSVIKIPEGYKLESLPKNAKVDNPFIYIEYTTQVEGDTITIELTYKLKKNIYEAKEYTALKNIFSTLINKIAEMVVLSKA